MPIMQSYSPSLSLLRIRTRSRASSSECRKKGIATIFFVNKLDRESADFYKVFEDLKGKFGPMVCPMVVPHVVDHKVECYVNLLEYRAYTYEDGKAKQVPIPDMGHRLEGLRTAMNEAVAETSEALMEKYFNGELVQDVGVYYSTTGRYNTRGLPFTNKQCAIAVTRTLIEENVP